MDFVEDANAYSALTLDPVTGLLFRPKLKHDIDVFTEDECINCFKQLLQGMSFLRREGVVHKDIKPENVLINYPVCQWRRFLNNTPHDMQSTWKHDRALQVTICDFNTAELVPDGRLYDAQGTVLFTPPEAFDFIDTDVGIDAYARDAWSVGMVGYYMLAGCNPIPNYASALEYQLTLIGMHHENRRIRIPDEIAPKNEIIREVIEDLLHPHPESRMTVDRALSILQ
jgi:serine/threonine protein kinase